MSYSSSSNTENSTSNDYTAMRDDILSIIMIICLIHFCYETVKFFVVPM